MAFWGKGVDAEQAHVKIGGNTRNIALCIIHRS